MIYGIPIRTALIISFFFLTSLITPYLLMVITERRKPHE
jgi:hypothetical protein